jgi:hypothetical protein
MKARVHRSTGTWTSQAELYWCIGEHEQHDEHFGCTNNLSTKCKAGEEHICTNTIWAASECSSSFASNFTMYSIKIPKRQHPSGNVNCHRE